MVSRVSLTHAELGKLLARAIFEAGEDASSPDRVQRIAFKGGKFPHKETNLGGFCESALADHIRTTLQDLNAPTGRRGP